MKDINFAEYIWLDGNQPTQGIRAKSRTVQLPAEPAVKDFPAWSFDGSSTAQAEGSDSDCLLEPVQVCRDPLRGPGNYLVLCEVHDAAGNPHSTNYRAHLRNVLAGADTESHPWLGFEQE